MKVLRDESMKNIILPLQITWISDAYKLKNYFFSSL